MNEKQQQLLFDKGITNVPSDILCSDNALEESVGMIYDNGEHRVIQKPTQFMEIHNIDLLSQTYGQILYVHNFDDQKRYIYIETNIRTGPRSKLVWGKNENGVLTPVEYFDDVDVHTAELREKIKITSIGKTLIITTGADEQYSVTTYYIWKGNSYVNKGSKLPDPTVRFWLVGGGEDFKPKVRADEYINNSDGTEQSGSEGKLKYYVYSAQSTQGIIADNYMQDIVLDQVIERGGQEEYNNMVVGLYAKNKKAVAQRKGFCLPFFVRYALELQDGTYTNISNPILMMPCITKNSFSIYYETEVMMMFTRFCKLYYSVESNGLEDFSDIVKNISIFVTRGIDVYDTSVSQPLEVYQYGKYDIGSQYVIEYDASQGAYYCHPLNWSSGYFNNLESDGIYRMSGLFSQYHKTDAFYGFATLADPTGQDPFQKVYFVKCDTLKQKIDYAKPAEQQEILDQIKAESVFYKICDVGLKDSTGDVAEKIGIHTLENLTTQDVLEEDDYYSRSPLHPSFIYSYNSRLNIANVSRGFFDGFMHFIGYDKSAMETDYRIAVRIKGDLKDYIIEKEFETNEQMGIYFYYPDSRADHFWLEKKVSNAWVCIKESDLTEHSGLNGAFYIDALPAFNGNTEPPTPTTPIDTYPQNNDNDERESLPNYIITSEVNNPWVFKASGYNKVGTGKIIGISTTTMALSQDQFGRTDLLVFSENGVWGMMVDSTGLYQSIHPMSREVCNNPKSITQTDGAVFFSSEKGLMIATDNGVKCVSEQLSGKTGTFSGTIDMGDFHEYLRKCFMAYDYRDSLLWIFTKATKPTDKCYCYVYSLKNGTFCKCNTEYVVDHVVSDYPDYIMSQDKTYKTLIGRPNINDDETKYSGVMISRPMKLENGLALKSLMGIRNLGQMDGALTLRIFASNNLDHWTELHSLRGMPWKYYRFRLDFTNLLATDRYAGTLVITQERRTNKLR